MFLTHSLEEFKKVNWPSDSKIQKDTVLVFLTTIALVGMAAVQDTFFAYLLSFLYT